MDDAIARALAPIGKDVSFKYPAGERDAHGVLKDRFALRVHEEDPVPYIDVVDLIRFDDGREPDQIRIGYYRVLPTRLGWGRQTTICEPISIWRRLLVEACLAKPWFRKLILDVAREVERRTPTR